MKKHTSIIMSVALALAIAYSLTSCGNKTKDMAAGIAAQAKTAVSMDDGKHNEAYIRERIDSMYSHIKYIPYNPEEDTEAYRMEHEDDDNPNLFDYDSMFCSTQYVELQKQCNQMSAETGFIFIDADHWIMGQDISEDWSYKVVKVSDITETTATVDMEIQNFGKQTGQLELVFERGDWYVNDFKAFFPDDDGKLKKYSELEEMRTFMEDGLKIREKAKTLVGEWGWVGDNDPELLIHLEMTDKGLACTECYIYRAYGFEKRNLGVTFNGSSLFIHDLDAMQSGYYYSERQFYLDATLEPNGDLKGTLYLAHPDHDPYEGPITLRKGYFKYEK